MNTCPYGSGDESSSSAGDASSSSILEGSSSSTTPPYSSGGSSSSAAPLSSSSADTGPRQVFKDPRDGREYKYEFAPDGEQAWMSENLNYSKGGTVGWCYGEGEVLGTAGVNLSGCDSPYGRTYTWEIAMDGNSSQGLCPDGWHIPSMD